MWRSVAGMVRGFVKWCLKFRGIRSQRRVQILVWVLVTQESPRSPPGASTGDGDHEFCFDTATGSVSSEGVQCLHFLL